MIYKVGDWVQIVSAYWQCLCTICLKYEGHAGQITEICEDCDDVYVKVGCRKVCTDEHHIRPLKVKPKSRVVQ